MSSQADRFGIRLHGINLLLPREQAAEYLADIAVYPIPLMPRRVRGAAQVAGRPVLVFAADVTAPDRLPVITRKSIVMLTERGSALALQVDNPPVALSAVVVSAQVRPALCFESALIAAYLGHDATPPSMRDSAEVWWDVDCVALFELLARDQRVVPLRH
jgi:hypothetical protein